MDLLVKNKLYKEVVEVYEICLSRNITGKTMVPRNGLLLAMCALFNMVINTYTSSTTFSVLKELFLYFQNTLEAYNQMLQILKHAKELGHFPVRRTLTYAAGLAINQGFPEVALELLNASQPNYVSIRNLKAIALARAGRIEQAFAILRGVINYYSPEGRKRTMLPEAVKCFFYLSA